MPPQHQRQGAGWPARGQYAILPTNGRDRVAAGRRMQWRADTGGGKWQRQWFHRRNLRKEGTARSSLKEGNAMLLMRYERGEKRSKSPTVSATSAYNN